MGAQQRLAPRHARVHRPLEPLYFISTSAGIIFFCFFYISIIFNPNEAADNMRKYGGFIPGIRPGRNTADYMNKILTRITMVGGLYLALLSMIPEIMISRNPAAARCRWSATSSTTTSRAGCWTGWV